MKQFFVKAACNRSEFCNTYGTPKESTIHITFSEEEAEAIKAKALLDPMYNRVWIESKFRWKR